MVLRCITRRGALHCFMTTQKQNEMCSSQGSMSTSKGLMKRRNCSHGLTCPVPT